MTHRRISVRQDLMAVCGAAAMLLVAPGMSGAQPGQRAILAAKLRAELHRIADDTKGVVGAQVIDLATGERIGVNDTLTFPQGSAIKIPLLIELYHQDDAGALKLSTRVPVRLADRTGGSGLLQNLGDGTSELSLGDLAMFMITVSDNTATNMLIDRVGMDKVNATARALGAPEVKLQRKMGGPIEASVPEGVRVAWKPGDIEGVNTAWGLVDLPGRPYVVVGMVNYSDADEGMKALRRIADAAYGYFHVLARSTPYGARVPLEVIPK